MSVRNAGNAIREARQKAALSQEKLSDGICSVMSLSRIENGTAGVSPATFQALMAHAGAPCEIFPVFENWDDYNCFFYLKHARFHLNAWQLAPAFEELEKTERIQWNHNKFYYQEWLMLHGMLQFRSGLGDHKQMYDTFLAALHITRPDIHLTDFRSLLLSLNEIELLTAIAQEALYLNQPDLCLGICTQIFVYLENSQITFLEKDKLLASHAIVYAKYLIAAGEYESAWKLADSYRHQMVLDKYDAPLFELTFLTGVCDFYLGKREEAIGHFKDTFYAAHAIKSCYATTCRNYVKDILKVELPENLIKVPDIPLKSFPIKRITDTSDFSDGIYDYYGADVITIGRLIRELRIQQKVSQQVLCQGLCSKSKLSKIENGTLNPDVILAETLLQRLGLSEREFVFWGNAKEAKFHELKFKLMQPLYLNQVQRKEYLNELKDFLSDKDSLYKQYLLYQEYESNCIPQEDKIRFLKDTLSCTLKDFNISRILDYRLSWLELTLLNCIAFEYRYTDNPYQGILYFRQLLEYRKIIQPDCILQSQTFTVTLHLFFRLLYSQRHYREIIDLYHQTDDISILPYQITRCSMIYFYYAQALGECSEFDNIPIPTRYCCGIENILDVSANGIALIEDIKKAFSIIINY